MTDRERLLQILNVPIHPRVDIDPMEAVADYLLDNGVTVRKKADWVMIPVQGVAKYRCGNIDCCRLAPFGVDPSTFNYCPYCGSETYKEWRDNG